jgi:predicted O-methyltransferase YrrM
VRWGRDWQRIEDISFHSGLGDSAWVLHGLVRALKPEICVEIGSARGKSACFIGLALRENGFGRLYAIDPHCPTAWNDAASVETYETMRQNLCRLGLEACVEIVRERSEAAAQAWSVPIDLLFIDGDHSYEAARRDWLAFLPFVRRFGVVLFHDTLWDLCPDPSRYRADMGVPRLVEELRREGYPVITLQRDYGLTMVQPVRAGISLRGPRP